MSDWDEMLDPRNPSPVSEEFDQTKECQYGHGPLVERPRKTRTSGKSLHCRECARLAQQRRRLREYGITVEDYDALWLAQNGLCALCGNPETQTRKGNVKALAVDHCHATGKVRALLCHACNCALGYLRDDPTLIRSAAAYIESHS